MALFLIQKSAWEMPQQTTFCTQDFLVPLLHGLSLFSAVKQDHFIPFASIENCLKFALFRLLIRVSPFSQNVNMQSKQKMINVKSVKNSSEILWGLFFEKESTLRTLIFAITICQKTNVLVQKKVFDSYFRDVFLK